MPTLAAGNKPSDGQGARRRTAAGFTLLELLVVVALVALATTGARLSLRNPEDSALEREAQRLAALLESARARSRATGVPVRWQPAEAGFEFVGAPAQDLPRHWLAAGVQAITQGPVLLGPEPLIAPQAIALQMSAPGADQGSAPPAPARRLWLVTDGLRPFVVQGQPGGAAP